ncbi:hypothetical protein PG985_016071 [Apiospora marii]|uniref:Uncharacterized protein n=1 Tax=Apiospora marii TaxID=335849 RepID=A0ABR1S3P3_9PEZI
MAIESLRPLYDVRFGWFRPVGLRIGHAETLSHTVQRHPHSRDGLLAYYLLIPTILFPSRKTAQIMFRMELLAALNGYVNLRNMRSDISLRNVSPFILELPRISNRFPRAGGVVLISLQCFANELISLDQYIVDHIAGYEMTLRHFFGVALFFFSGFWWFFCTVGAILSFQTHDREARIKSGARFLFYTSPALLCLGGLFAGLGFFPVNPLSYYTHEHPISRAHYVFLMGISIVIITLCLTSAALYALAVLWGHRYVSSKTLGGSGVEAMRVVFRGQGHALESVDTDQADEADQGRIRL